MDQSQPPEVSLTEIVRARSPLVVHFDGSENPEILQADEVETVRGYTREAVSFVGVELSLAVIVTEKFPAVLGVPLRTPVALFKLRPAGKPAAA